ncbi:MAG: helix-turn-helix transcriptional regulator [Anaerolineae bacterium]|nr:helix-turn-helix transcriptional regulator [Anaerolineae bacterium]
MSALAKQIGNRIKTARLAAELTQEEVAAPLGIGRAAYSNIENGHSLVTVDHLLKLPAILHKPVTHFLGIETENLTPAEAEWLELYRILPADAKALVLGFVQVAAQQARERAQER